MADDLTGAGITAKERLERIEQMLSDVSRQLDVRFLEVEHRLGVLETARAVEDSNRSQIAEDLKEAEALMAREVASIKEGQISTKTLIRSATALLVLLGVSADVLIRFFAK